jgi:nucleotide-binding universal stress UspA family protein
MNFQRILVPVDFSPCSQEAFRTAVTLCLQFKGELLVLHVLDTRIVEVLAGVGEKRIEEVRKSLRKKTRARLRSFISGLPIPPPLRRRVVEGVPFQEIVRTARLEQAELIVMGRYGGTGEIEKIFFGSTAEKVVRTAPCAILCIPLTEKERKLTGKG